MDLGKHIAQHSGLQVEGSPLLHATAVPATVVGVGNSIATAINIPGGLLKDGDTLELDALVSTNITSTDTVTFLIRPNAINGPSLVSNSFNVADRRSLQVCRQFVVSGSDLIAHRMYATSENTFNLNPLERVPVDLVNGFPLYIVLNVSTAANTAGKSITVHSSTLRRVPSP